MAKALIQLWIRQLRVRVRACLTAGACGNRGRRTFGSPSRGAIVLLALLLPLSSISLAAPAEQPQSYNYSKQGGISVEQAAAMVRRETGGRVLSANPVKSNGQRGYNIRVLIDGKRVKQYYVDNQGRMSPD